MTCKDCICCEVCYYKSFNDVRNLKKRRNDVEKICKSFVHRDSVKNAPTVDAVEVVHGRWVDKTKVIVKPPFPPIESARVDCSVCGHIFWHTSALTYNYCPNCGADMRGETE